MPHSTLFDVSLTSLAAALLPAPSNQQLWQLQASLCLSRRLSTEILMCSIELSSYRIMISQLCVRNKHFQSCNMEIFTLLTLFKQRLHGYKQKTFGYVPKNDENVIIVVAKQLKRNEQRSAVGKPWALPPARQSSQPALCDPTCCYCPVLVIPHIPEPRRGIPGPLTQIVVLH